MLTKAGQAMARFKEEKCFREFSRHGHIVFDADATASNYTDGGVDKSSQFLTHGTDIDGTANGTMNDEDFFDLFFGLMAREYVPTDVLMHPLVWSIFAKNAMLEKLPLAAFGGANNKIAITPDVVNGRLPFDLNITLSPFIPFSATTSPKKFDMYVVDRNGVGCLLVKDELSTEQWDSPERDIQNIKVKERYGVGLFDDGRAISVAKNIHFEKSYPLPQRVKMLS